MANRPAGKVCLVGSQKTYPAFDSLSSILKLIFGQENVVEIRNKDLLPKCPPQLNLPLYILQDLALCFKIISSYKKEKIKVVLLFQGYFVLSSMTSKLLNLRLIIFIGGSGFRWSYLESSSTTERVLSYLNLPLQEICHKLADTLVTLSEKMTEMTGLENYRNKTKFALPRLDKSFFDQFTIMKRYADRGNIVGFVGYLCK
jgi:hypothetical protein